jgi:diadenosine tetraphosphate (Ap4A) HIT family hydrolase
MSFHTDYDTWVNLSDPQNCPVCLSLPMPSDMVDIIELPHSWLNAQPVDCLKGACHVTARKHVVELFELDENELLGLMTEVQCYARALKQVTGAVKINYEIHGNTTPHLHIHLYPRYMDDPYPGQPIEYGRTINQFEDGEFERFIGAMRKEIGYGIFRTERSPG